MTTTKTISTDPAARKQRPIARGVLDYFPLAIAEISHVSFKANEQHNPGEEMRWAKEKSADHADCLVRHLLERGTLDTDDLRHTAKVAWRALALLETELERGPTAGIRYFDHPESPHRTYWRRHPDGEEDYVSYDGTPEPCGIDLVNGGVEEISFSDIPPAHRILESRRVSQ